MAVTVGSLRERNIAGFTWVGVHDYQDSIQRWLDPDRSFTWLESFRLAKGIERIAFCGARERNLDLETDEITYHFRMNHTESWADEIINCRPSMVLWNICYYHKSYNLLRRVSEAILDVLNVIRLHHEINYLAAQPGFLRFLLECDVAIVPDAKQAQDCRSLGFLGEIFVLPFGINTDIFFLDRSQKRTLDIVSATNRHPGRNIALLKAVYEKLDGMGVSAQNFQGLGRRDLAKQFKAARFFWLTSMTEASGSRVLLEAISCGCYPIVFEECLTAARLVREMGYGYIIKSGIIYDYQKKSLSYPNEVVQRITQLIWEISNTVEKEWDPSIPPKFLEQVESQELLNILLFSQVRRSRLTQRAKVLSKVNGHFNPSIAPGFESPSYEIVGRVLNADGTRELGFSKFTWGGPLKPLESFSSKIQDKMGADIPWQADPRIFYIKSEKYIIFNTGHSSIPNEQYIVQLPGKKTGPKRAKKILWGKRRLVEKNWSIFSYMEELYAIYSLSPFKLLKLVNTGSDYVATESHHQIFWDANSIELFGELRGGSSPILIDDMFLLVFQQHLAVQGKKNYFAGALWFECTPPFRPLRISSFPIFSLSEDERALKPEIPPNKSAGEVFYPCGAVYRRENNSILVSYGINDCRYGIGEFDYSEILNTARPIKVLS